MSVPPTIGIILAGGLATRMGGGDKVLQRIGGVSLLEFVADRLATQCDILLLNANGDPSRFTGYGLPVVPDNITGHPGPLAGILAGLDHIARGHPRHSWALTISGDTPFPPIDLVERLHAARKAEDADIAIAASGGRLHPTIALWPVALRRAMRTFVADEKQRRVRAFADRHRTAVVEWPTDPFDPFLNINTPEDLAAAQAVADRQAASGGKLSDIDPHRDVV